MKIKEKEKKDQNSRTKESQVRPCVDSTSRVKRVVARLGYVRIFLTGLCFILAFGPRVACASGGLEVVAHQDDDFLFMNPDVQNAIWEGLPTVTVYMTAGEAVGTAPRCPGALCPGAIAADRQHGIRAAYAQMDGLSPDAGGGYESYWNRALWRPDGVHWVERYTPHP